MANLMIINKKIFNNLYNEEKKKFLKQIEKEVQKVEIIYKNLKEEAKDFILEHCSNLKNNENFKDIQNINMYLEYNIFIKKINENK